MLSLGNLASDRLLGSYRLGSLLWKLLLALRTSCLEPFVKELSLGIVRLGFVVWNITDGIVRFGTCVCNVSLDILRLGTFGLYF